LYVVESGKPVDRRAADIEQAGTRNKFGLLGGHNLKEKMAEKGVAFEAECRIFEVCNPHRAKEVLEANMEISTALPCRISLYREGEKTKLATLRPTALIDLFSGPELRGVAEEVEATLVRIMDEAAR
ncbi:MAG: DUF302 domain-containing protein, partial [Nitrospinota bacterium]